MGPPSGPSSRGPPGHARPHTAGVPAAAAGRRGLTCKRGLGWADFSPSAPFARPRGRPTASGFGPPVLRAGRGSRLCPCPEKKISSGKTKRRRDGRACSRAAIRGHLHVLKWLRANRCPWDGWTCEEAASHGQLELLRWAVENGCEVDEVACVVAAQCGHLEVLQWMRANAWRANSCPWDKDILIKGAQGGSLEVIQWLRVAQRCRWSPEAIKGAAMRGHLDAVKWLRANGCPWHAKTCEAAAEGGHLEILRWALENGCEWNAEMCAMIAASQGRFEVLQWMRAEGRPLAWGLLACHGAVEYGQVEVLRWARANGARWTAADRDKAAAELGYTDNLGNLLVE